MLQCTVNEDAVVQHLSDRPEEIHRAPENDIP